MNILNEIKEAFAALKNNRVILIESLEKEYPAWIYRQGERFGVAIEVNPEILISERFSNAKIKTETLEINGIAKHMITLSSNIIELRNEFALVCTQFVEPGLNGEQRQLIMNTPRIWWERWISLLGNSIKSKQPYELIGELLTLKYLLKIGKNPKWIGHKGMSHDIEYDGGTCEVKSTTTRYGYLVKINSQFQLKAESFEFNLAFLRFEPTINGISINSLAKELVLNGYPESELDFALEALGYEEGMGIRDDSYTVLDARFYPVDNEFPKITNLSFFDGKIPNGIVKIEYTVDLDNLRNIDFLTEV